MSRRRAATRTVDPETGLTSCCEAFSTISMDDFVEYCKACYEPVVPADSPVVLVLPVSGRGRADARARPRRPRFRGPGS